MAKRAIWNACLQAAGGAGLFLAAAEDARRRFDLLNPGILLLLLLLAVILAARSALHLRDGKGHARALRAGTALIAAAAAALSANALALQVRNAAFEGSWREGEERGIEERSTRVRAEFGALLGEMQEPILRARSLVARSPRSAGPTDPERAFEVIDALTAGRPSRGGRLCASIHAAFQTPLAWKGPCHPIPRELRVLSIPPETTKWIVVQGEGLSRLLALSRPWSDPRLLLSVETLVKSIYDGRVQTSVFSEEAIQHDEDRVDYADYRNPPILLQDLFDGEGDVLRTTGTARPLVRVALRAPDGALLGYARLAGRKPGAVRQALLARHHTLATWIAAGAAGILVGASLLPRPSPVLFSPGREILRQSLRLLGIWTFRLLLLRLPLPVRFAGRPLDDPSLYARAGFWDLLRSPQDSLLTALAVLASGVLISLAATRILLARRRSLRRSGLVYLGVAMLIAFLLGTNVTDEVARFVENSRVDVLTVRPFNPAPVRMILQASATFTLTGFMLPLVTLTWGALWALVPRRQGGGSPPPVPTEETLRWTALLLIPSAVGSCLVLELALQPAATRALEHTVKHSLASSVRAMPTLRRFDLSDALDAVESYPALADRIISTPPEGDPALAHELWSVTPLAYKGYAASLTVRGEEGTFLSRYSRNFPPILDSRTLERDDIEAGHIESFVCGPRQREVRALHAHSLITKEGRPVGTVTIHLRDDFGDLPPLTPPTPLVEALGEDRPLSLPLPPWARTIGLAVYTAQGVPTLANPRDPPPPPPQPQREKVLTDFREGGLWMTRDVDDLRTHVYFFGSAGHLVGLSFPEPGPTTRLARAIRLSTQTVVFLMILVIPWALGSALRLGWRLDPARLAQALTRTHYRRLVTTFLLASLAPLTLLAFALTGYVKREIEEYVSERGWTVLEAARRQVEDFGVLQGAEGPPDDAYLFGLGEDVREDLSLFIDGDLRAASNRELYTYAALPTRVDSETHRRISVEGQRIVLGHTEIGGRSYRTISGVVSLGLAGEGILSILLTGQNLEVERRAQEIYDALLLAYASVVLFMSVLAYVLARRIAAPIRRLSEATARIAMGDLHAEVSFPPRDETGDLIASFNAMARALRRQRDDLEQRGNYIEKILLNATTGVLSVDLGGRIVTINPAAVSILDLKDLGPGQDLISRLSESPDFATLARAVSGCLRSPTAPVEVQAELGPEGEERHARARIVPFTEGSGLLIFLDDVTETVRSNRLAAWAEMARRIAHEIKNPLTPIQLSADHIRRVFADDSPAFPEVLDECLRTILEQVASLRAIATQFTFYARHTGIRKEPTPMGRLLEDVVRPYRVAPPQGVSVECDIRSDLPAMDVDRVLISQAIVNLIENALQAMPDGGRLMVRASVSATDGGRGLNIEIGDTGVGMDREALARAFEPYFSTKGTGTGLGMAIARRAVEEHQGRIELTSALHRGTTARITLPLP